MLNDRTLVPLRFVGEAFGTNVGWNEATQTVSITSNNSVPVQETVTNNPNPVVYKEIRYLPAKDEVYIRADVHPNNPKENDWPTCWVGIYDLQNNKWLYNTDPNTGRPDRYNEMWHVRYENSDGNHIYEKSIPGSIIPRNTDLALVIYVDSYNNIIKDINQLQSTKLAITPVSKGTWKVKYNLEVDEIEAFATPDSPVAELPDLYFILYEDNGIERYPIKSYTEPLVALDNLGKGKYFRSWKLPDSIKYEVGKKLNLKRDGTYYGAVVARGFEDPVKEQIDKESLVALKDSFFDKVVEPINITISRPVIMVSDPIIYENINFAIAEERELINKLIGLGYGQEHFTSILKALDNSSSFNSSKLLEVLNRAIIAHRYLIDTESFANDYAKSAGEDIDEILKYLFAELLKIKQGKMSAANGNVKLAYENIENSIILTIGKLIDDANNVLLKSGVIDDIGAKRIKLIIESFSRDLNSVTISNKTQDGITATINSMYSKSSPGQRGVMADQVYIYGFSKYMSNELKVIDNYVNEYLYGNTKLSANTKSAKEDVKKLYLAELEESIVNIEKLFNKKAAAIVLSGFKEAFDIINNGLLALTIVQPELVGATGTVGAFTKPLEMISDFASKATSLWSFSDAIAALQKTNNTVRWIPRKAFSKN